MLLNENKKAKLINILKLGISPFKNFVSTGEIQEYLGLIGSRREVFESIQTILETNKDIILPIIGEVGSGKTHLFWTLKNNLHYHNSIYISLEYVYKKFFYKIYSEFIETLGVDVLRFIVNQLASEWGSLNRIYGFFHVADKEKVKGIALDSLKFKYPEESEKVLEDIVNCIINHQLDPYKKVDAERWLLGELIDIKELVRLNLSGDLHKGKNAYMMLKILIENSKLDTLLFIDDFERIIMTPEGEEVEEVFDPSWLYGNEKSPDEIASEKIYSKITSLREIKGLNIIITLRSIEALEELKRRFQEIDPNLLSSIKEPIMLSNFNENDIYTFFIESMRKFYVENDFKDLYEEFKFQNEYFPLKKKILKVIYDRCNGNPREIIKTISEIFNRIIFSTEGLETIMNEYEEIDFKD